MRKKRRFGIKHIVFFMCFCMFSVTSISNSFLSKTVVHAESENSDTEKKKERFVLDSKTRIGKYARQNENTEIVTTVTNNGEDFKGYIQIIMKNEESGKNIMYQTDLVLAAGETKSIGQEIRMTTGSRIMVHVTDLKEEILKSKSLKVSFLPAEESLIGVLSDNKQEMGYLDSSQNVAYLSKKDISSAKGMKVMDVLIINDFNTGDLKKEQYEAIKEWVELGGTLILGTGEQVNRTLAMFQDDYLVGKIGKVEKGVADISFQEENITDKLVNGIVLHQVKKGLGVISISNKSLGIDKTLWEKKGYEYINAIESQYSKALQKRLEGSNATDYYIYNDNDILKSSDEIPSVKNLGIILFVYILIITLGVYIVLKKKDKLEWTWGVVPVAGIIFAGVIIAMGAKTRVDGVYINYKNVMEFQEEGNSSVRKANYMDVASASNSNYELKVPKGMEVYSDLSYGFYDNDYNNKQLSNYNVGFKTRDNQKIVVLKDNPVFESVGLVAESYDKIKGSYQSDIRYVDAMLSGTFTNNTEFTIKNGILMAEGRLYKLGTMKPGETVEITDKTTSIDWNLEYDYYKVAGIDADSKKWSLDEARYIEALQEESYQYVNSDTRRNIIYGYIETSDDNMKKDWGVDCYGLTIAKFPIEVDYTTEDGDIYVADILQEGMVQEGSYDSQDRIMYWSEEEDFIVDYKLETNEQLTGIYFSELLNPSIHNFDNNVSNINYYGEKYEGDIEVYNWKTKSYEVIFKAENAGEVTDIKKYVGKDNTIRFKMNPDNTSEWEIYIPVISITKEVKANG